MRRIYPFVFLFVCFCFNSGAQIIAPDTVCPGTSIDFTSTKPAVTYHWDFNDMSVVQPLSPTTFVSAGFTVPSWTCFMKDGPNYYCFVSSYTTGIITRLSFGSSIYSPPVVSSLGTLGGTAPNTECLDIVKDSVTGDWYGLLVNNSQMIVLSFGPSLASTPTATVTTYAELLWAHQVTIKRYGGAWHAFVANRSSGITRFDFGSSLTNPPVVTNIPNVGGVSTPCGFTLFEQGGSWYMLVTNLIAATVSRYDFGTNLLNNAPTGTLLTSPPGMLNLPRPIFILNDCHNNLIAYVINESGNINKMDFAGSITNMPVYTSMGPSGVTSIASGAPCAYNDSFFYLLPSFGAGTISKFSPFGSAEPTALSYFTPSYPTTLSTTGVYNVSLFYDMGRPSGPSVSCKTVDVDGVQPITGTLSICVGSATALSDGTFGGTWSSSNPGVATIDPVTGLATGVSPGTTTISYTVAAGCIATATLTVVSLTAITGSLVICTGLTSSLASTPGGGTWISLAPGVASVGPISGIVTGVSSGTATIVYSLGGCTTSTVVTVNPSPTVWLGNDTSFCIGNTYILSSTQPVGSTFTWSTGSTTDSIHVMASGSFTLTVTNSYGCTAADAISVLVSPFPIVDLGPDTANCDGNTVILKSSVTYTVPVYLWSNFTTGDYLPATMTGTYWLQVTENGCSAADTVHVIIAYDTFTVYTNDTAICRGKSVQVLATGNPELSYQWLPTAGVPLSTVVNPFITPDTSAMYKLKVSFPGCPDRWDSLFIDVQPNPVVRAGSNRHVCRFDTIRIDPSVTPGWYTHYSFSWIPATSLDFATSKVVIFTAGDTTNLVLKVTTPAGCYGMDSAMVIVYPSDFAQVSNDTTVCPHDSVLLTASGGVSYRWTPSMYLDNDVSAACWAKAITSQNYTVVATNDNGCRDTLKVKVTVKPAAVIHLVESVVIYPGQSYHIDPQTNCTRFQWTPSGGLSNPYLSDPIATPEVSTKYLVYGVTEWGCKTVDSIYINIDPKELIDLPNAFAPGSVNSRLHVIKRGAVSLNYFRIFNRWGNLVFETKNIEEGWDGTYKGQPQPEGVYVYVVEATTSTGKLLIDQGNVTLFR